MNAISGYTSLVSNYIPAAVKDVAGLNPQISEDVRHITWMGFDSVYWITGSHRLFLVLGYIDGFQVWDVQDSNCAREILSKQDKAAVTNAKLMPVAMQTKRSDSDKLGATSAPLLAYVQQTQPALVRFFSMRTNDVIYVLRLTQPAISLQASRRVFAVGMMGQVDLYDPVHFGSLFSVQCFPSTNPAFALGQRWVAYNLPPQGTQYMLGTGSLANHMPATVKDGIKYIKGVGQRTLDHLLMPPDDGAPPVGSDPARARSGVVAVRDVVSRGVIAQFEDHLEPIELMTWDPSGLLLVSCTANGHSVLVHKALAGAERAALLVLHDTAEGGVALGSVVFQHLYTLSRGYTPAVISDIAISDDMQLIAVSSAKGTTHVFSLPPFHSPVHGPSTANAHLLSETPGAALASSPPRHQSRPGGVPGDATSPVHIKASTRVKLGSMLLQEGLMPKCAFQSGSGSLSARSLCAATRTGMLSFFALKVPKMPSIAPTASASSRDKAEGGVEVGLTKQVRAYRTHKHFTEKMFSLSDLGKLAQASPALRPAASPDVDDMALMPSPRNPPSLPSTSPRLEPQGLSGNEQSKWLSQVETATHVSREVPLWFWPQMSFHVFQDQRSAEEVNLLLRSARSVPERRPLHFKRVERPGDTVRYDAGDAVGCSENHVSQSLSGAIGATMREHGAGDDRQLGHQANNQRGQYRRGPAPVQIGAAWCAHMDAATLESHLDDSLDDEWVKAELIGN